MTASLWPRSRQALLEQATADLAGGWVHVDRTAIEALPQGTLVSTAQMGALPGPAGPAQLSNLLPYLVALSSINHRFWTLDVSKRFCRYAFQGEVGANAMFGAFQRHWSNSASALSLARWSQRPITAMDVVDLFGPIPGATERAQILNEVLLGPALAWWAGHLQDKLSNDQAITVTDAAELADFFPLAFGDPYLKKAQFALSHVARHAQALGHSVRCDLTAFADYQIPAVLRTLGLIRYEPELAQAVDQGHCLVAGSAQERAIRGASILAVEALAHRQHARVIDVDQWLWLRRREATAPFHLTLTSAY